MSSCSGWDVSASASCSECHNRSRYPEGDHVIFVSKVEQCDDKRKPGSVFHAGRFAALK